MRKDTEKTEENTEHTPEAARMGVQTRWILWSRIAAASKEGTFVCLPRFEGLSGQIASETHQALFYTMHFPRWTRGWIQQLGEVPPGPRWKGVWEAGGRQGEMFHHLEFCPRALKRFNSEDHRRVFLLQWTTVRDLTFKLQTFCWWRGWSQRVSAVLRSGGFQMTPRVCMKAMWKHGKEILDKRQSSTWLAMITALWYSCP